MTSIRVKQQTSRSLLSVKENICPTRDPGMSIKTIPKEEELVDGRVNRNLTPLRQTLLDFSPKQSPTVNGLSTPGVSKPETTASELADTVYQDNKVNQAIASEASKAVRASPATLQTTLESTVLFPDHRSKLKKPAKESRQKSENTLATAPRHRSVDQRTATQCGLPRNVRSKAISVSPKKSLVKRDNVDDSARLPGKKHQTQLTTFGIRRTARQFAKDMQRERDANVYQCLRDNVEEGLKIIFTEEKGRGIVATRTFRDEEFVVEYAGDLIPEKEAKLREAEYKRDPSIGSYMFYFSYNGQKYCVDATAETTRLGRLINHSRLHPNCQVRTIPLDGVPKLVLFARRPILPGEELLYDYGDRDKETLEAHPWLKT